MAKVQFDSVLLEFEIGRLGSTRGIAQTNTAKFSVGAGNTIEYDTDKGLVHIGHKSGGLYVVPISRVKYFEPLPAPPPAIDVETEPVPADEPAPPVKRGPGRPPKNPA